MRRDEALHEERRGVLGTPRPPAEGGAGAATAYTAAVGSRDTLERHRAENGPIFTIVLILFA